MILAALAYTAFGEMADKRDAARAALAALLAEREEREQALREGADTIRLVRKALGAFVAWPPTGNPQQRLLDDFDFVVAALAAGGVRSADAGSGETA